MVDVVWPCFCLQIDEAAARTLQEVEHYYAAQRDKVNAVYDRQRHTNDAQKGNHARLSQLAEQLTAYLEKPQVAVLAEGRRTRGLTQDTMAAMPEPYASSKMVVLNQRTFLSSWQEEHALKVQGGDEDVQPAKRHRGDKTPQ